MITSSACYSAPVFTFTSLPRDLEAWLRSKSMENVYRLIISSSYPISVGLNLNDALSLTLRTSAMGIMVLLVCRIIFVKSKYSSFSLNLNYSILARSSRSLTKLSIMLTY